MGDELLEVFCNFIDFAKNELRPPKSDSNHNSEADNAHRITLPIVVEKLEHEDRFERLLEETQKTFSGTNHHKGGHDSWSRAIHNFFSRSGCYGKLADGEPLNNNDLFSRYYTSFVNPKPTSTFLVPLEYVSFSQKHMEFSDFKITRFSSKELDAILQNDVNRVFYPWASTNVDSSRLLSQYWFLRASQPKDPDRVGLFTFPATLATTGQAEREFTQYPKPIEMALRQLSLFDWPQLTRQSNVQKALSEEAEEYEIWVKFNLPFIIEVNDDFIDLPKAIPSIQGLDIVPSTDPETQDERNEPQVNIYLDQHETDDFIQTVKRIGNLVNSLPGDNKEWDFFQVGLGYFVKAYISFPGIEQLLWYICSLEALLGEPRDVTETLSRRIGLILGKDKRESIQISKRFRNLYDVRSSLVHGRSKSKTDSAAINDAYRFSRFAIIWFLHYLNDIEGKIAASKMPAKRPKRQEILTMIDADANIRERIHWLINAVPLGFPCVNQWTTP